MPAAAAAALPGGACDSSDTLEAEAIAARLPSDNHALSRSLVSPEILRLASLDDGLRAGVATQDLVFCSNQVTHNLLLLKHGNQSSFIPHFLTFLTPSLRLLSCLALHLSSRYSLHQLYVSLLTLNT